MNDIQAAKALGLFSIGLGVIEIAFGRRLNRLLGLGQSPLLVRAFGAREVAAGAMALMKPDSALPIWFRLGGDALDLGVLAGGLGSRRRDAAAAATLAVMGVTALDALTAVSLSRRSQRALATARSARVRS